ncbi:hypothetical protein BZA70DRAFT_278397 [Myxozyma melibiosi]|uniref:Ribosome biogenesis protein NSA1 n=1 Tax=Myxozyma melibiosi TaxID=54550 RepID=A0ABR1F6T9_9ASCO
MRVFVAAEDSGSLKDISFSFGTNTSVKGSRAPNITTFASEGRSAFVQRMTLVKLSDGKQGICVARKGGIVQLYDIDPPYALLNEWKGQTLHGDSFVGLEHVNGILSSVTSSGKLVMRDLQSAATAALEYYAFIGDPVNAYRVHPNRPNIIAYAGKERELEISQITNVQTAEDAGDSSSSSSSKWCVAPPQYGPYNAHELALHKLWRAKNVKNDELELRVPVWISDIRFLDCDRAVDAQSLNDFRVAVTTRFGHIRLYETSKSRRPLVNVEVGEHPLVALAPTAKENEVVFCDTHAVTAKFDVTTGRKNSHFSGSTGSTLCLDTLLPSKIKEEEEEEGDGAAPSTSADVGLLATGGLDRYLHVYNLETRQLVGKVYVGTKLSAISIVDGQSTDGTVSERESEYEDEDGKKMKVKDEEDAAGGKRFKKRKTGGEEGEDNGSVSDPGSTASSANAKHVRFENGSEEEDDEEEDEEAVWRMLGEDGDLETIEIKADDDDVEDDEEEEERGASSESAARGSQSAGGSSRSRSGRRSRTASRRR